MHHLHYDQALKDHVRRTGSLDLAELGRIETYVRRRGQRSSVIGDPERMVLDVLEGRPGSKMASLDAADEVSDARLAKWLDGVVAFDVPSAIYGVRFRSGDYLKVAHRAYVVLERISVIRGAQRRGLWKRERVEAAARMVGEYHVWKWMPRHLRDKDHPKSLEAFALGYGLEAADVRQTLYLARYPKWSARYLAEPSKKENSAEIKDVLMDAIRKQEHVSPEKVNANLFRIALMANGELKGEPGVQVNVDNRSVTLNLTEAELGERRARLAAYSARYFKGAPDVCEAQELPVAADHEHEGPDRAVEPAGGAVREGERGEG